MFLYIWIIYPRKVNFLGWEASESPNLVTKPSWALRYTIYPQKEKSLIHWGYSLSKPTDWGYWPLHSTNFLLGVNQSLGVVGYLPNWAIGLLVHKIINYHLSFGCFLSVTPMFLGRCGFLKPYTTLFVLISPFLHCGDFLLLPLVVFFFTQCVFLV